MDGQYRLRLLGPLILEQTSPPLPRLQSRKALALLGYLARQDHPVARSALAGMFWGETSDSRAHHNLTRELSQLTARLPDCFQADYHSVQWAQADPACVDTAHCAALLAREPRRFANVPSDDLRALGDTPLSSDTWFAHAGADSRDPARLSAAVALYRGEFMADLYLDGCQEFESWLIREREHWRRQVTDALNALIAHHALRHADDQAQVYARRWLEIEPGQEDAHCYLLVLLARNGKRGAALVQYDACRHALASELGVAPAPETVALYEQIRAGALDQQPAVPPTTVRAAGRAASALSSPRRTQSWGDPPVVGACYGRTDELTILERWLIADRCRLVGLVGMGEVGKTTLAATLVGTLAPRFAAVFWCSLLNAPPLDSVLWACLQCLSDQQLPALPEHLDEQLTLLIDQLCHQRCLIILDNVESLFQPGDRARHYRPGYAAYEQLIQRLGQAEHQSCVLLMSREEPPGLARLAAHGTAARLFHLDELAALGHALVTQHDLSGPADAYSAEQID